MHIPQSLHDLYPDDADLLRRLKAEDGHFQALAAELEQADEDVRKIDTDQDPASDMRREDAHKRRLALLDRIAPLIAAHRPEAAAS